ncbi:hypothetical protein CWO91_16750 [Bradyrhizobium genosp. SA-3]|uniref:hypothetical protein n=1 Tax=Bradyrhizobium genosp. SA-3 TaxID=508868 RepID=UPI001029FFAE|nr:hypothetical protein [Bradyrhizobium genosp. SA-3]RZN09677.1 hypothetical protein CWO91_16750 [Bradyrhizobium genosp. SA-3]
MNVAPNFGADTPPEQVTYQAIAAQIRSLNPRALTPASLEDVILMIEWMQEETIKRDEELTRRGNELTQREAELQSWEKRLQIKQRAVDAVLKRAPDGRRYWWFGRKGS